VVTASPAHHKRRPLHHSRSSYSITALDAIDERAEYTYLQPSKDKIPHRTDEYEVKPVMDLDKAHSRVEAQETERIPLSEEENETPRGRPRERKYHDDGDVPLPSYEPIGLCRNHVHEEKQGRLHSRTGKRSEGWIAEKRAKPTSQEEKDQIYQDHSLTDHLRSERRDKKDSFP